VHTDASCVALAGLVHATVTQHELTCSCSQPPWIPSVAL
jgi:hypothetical protein